MEEIWKPVKGFEGRYEISNHGRLKSIGGRWKEEKIIMPNKTDSGGYYNVSLRSVKHGIKRKGNYIQSAPKLATNAFFPIVYDYLEGYHKPIKMEKLTYPLDITYHRAIIMAHVNRVDLVNDKAGKFYNCLIDTGAPYSYLNHNIIKDLSLTPKSEAIVPTRDAYGNVIKSKIYEAAILIKDQWFKHLFLCTERVLPKDYIVLLGTDFLIYYSCEFTYNSIDRSFSLEFKGIEEKTP